MAQVTTADEVDVLIEDLREAGLLTGYDENTLRLWKEAGAQGQRPELSWEIKARFDGYNLAEEQEREQCGYHNWLVQAEKRMEAEAEAKVLREYPVSYPAHLAELAAEKAREDEERRARLKVEAAMFAETQRLKEEQRAQEHDIRIRMEEYIFRNGTLNDVSPAEYIDFVEHIATQNELAALDTRLKRDVSKLRKSGDPDRLGDTLRQMRTWIIEAWEAAAGRFDVD